MTGNSTAFKVKIVSEYLRGGISLQELAKKYHIPLSGNMRVWIKRAQSQGLDSLIVKHTKREYSSDFKLEVVEYVQTHEVSRSSTAVKFGISPSQVSSWMSRYKHQGVAGLRDKPRGRRSTAVSKRKKRATLSSTKEEQYKQTILELKHELYETRMDRDILKTLATITARDQERKQTK
ncbi:helix-turn-helix domain-containing protein [Lacticaseibacillus sharpeae]|uniref:helix-turn-helix domain-containing protein n=1 Tax=Lacticaseibacillus sharpeae TaxID=1626 RepID=UPI000A5DD9E8|nr:helix-turn-helix domain-containing protein [Lacticaseibacillus sharpeae]